MRFVGKSVPRLVLTTLLGFVTACVFAQSPVPPKASETTRDLEAEILLGAARNAVHRDDIDTALQRFSQFVREYPDRDDGRREYADTLFKAGRARQALPEYEKLLKRYPDDPKLIETLIDAWLNVGDHPRAKARLAEALRRLPDRVDFALSLALLHALDDETAEAEALIRNEIQGRPLTSDRMRLEAAALYIQLKRKRLAEPLIAELLESMPDNAQVLALSVRYALLIGDHKLAVRQATKLDRLYPGNIGLRLELAAALYAARDYAEAGRLFRDVLRRAPENQTALLGAAHVALRNYEVAEADAFLNRVPENQRGRSWQLVTVERDTIAGNYLRAHVTLDHLLVENPKDTRAAMAMADLDRAENEFIKADCRYYANGAMEENSAATEQLAVSLFLQRRYAAAEQACRHVLQQDSENTRTMILLARILVKVGCRTEAAHLIARASTLDKRLSPEGMYFTYFLSGDFACCAPNGGTAAPPPGPWETIAPGTAEPEPSADDRPIYLAVTLADLAMEDGRRAWAKAVLDEALAVYPENLVLRTRLAEWHASFGLACPASQAAAVYEQLLCLEPSNQKWVLGLARANATMRCYDRALALYGQLRCESPDSYLYARERARVTFHVCGTTPGLDAYDSSLCGWSGLEEEAARLRREAAAKCMHHCIPSRAADTYAGLLSLEPYESHFAFELGQVYGNLGTTRLAIDSYSRLLSAAPNQRDARVALEGKCLDLRPKLLTDHRFVHERGRDGLTAIDRLGDFVGYHVPLADENEFLELGYGRLNLAPTRGGATSGDALVVKYQKQVGGDFASWLSPYAPLAVFIDCEVQRYDRYVSTRPVFEAGLILRTHDDLVWTVAAAMDNVLENGESLLQDIYRGGLHVDLDFMPNNYWETNATGEIFAYSDDNVRYAAEFQNRLQLTPDPRRLSLLADFYYWTFAHPSQFSPGPDPYLNMVHPYWAPSDFAMTGVGVEWKQWLSRDRFDGADHCWISFSAMKRWDSENQNYTIYRGMFVWDITRRLSGYATGEYNESAPYHATRAYAGLSWTF